MRYALVGLVICAVWSAAVEAGEQDRTHTSVSKSERFDIHVRPGSRAAASVEAWAARADRFFARIETQLAFTPPKRMRLYLYDSVSELQAITGTKAAGFAVPEQAHVPFDNPQTAYHELVHLFAHQLPKSGAETRDLFFVEGLANALLTYVHGVHVHAVARYYLDTKRLPALKAISQEPGLVGWSKQHPKLRSYDIAGSFLRFLLDTYDVDAVKRFYTGTPAAKAFGVDLPVLEAAWHTALRGYRLQAEVVTLLRREEGETVAFTHWEADPEKRLPPEIRGEPTDWTTLTQAALHPDERKLWSRREGVVTGAEPGGKDWRACEFGNTKHVDCAVMARLSIPEFCPAIQIRLGDGCQAMFVTNGTFLYRGNTGIKGNGAFANPGRGEVHLTLVRQGHDVRVFVNGTLALHVPNADATPARPGVGFLGGTVECRELKLRKLPKASR